MYYVVYSVATGKIKLSYNTVQDLDGQYEAHIDRFAVIDQDSNFKPVAALRSHPYVPNLLDVQSFEQPAIVWASVEQFVNHGILIHKQKLAGKNLVVSDTQVKYYVDLKDHRRSASTLLDIQKRLDDAGVARAIH